MFVETYEDLSLHGDEEHGLGFGDEAERGGRGRRDPGALAAGLAKGEGSQVDGRRADAREVEEARESDLPTVLERHAWGMRSDEIVVAASSSDRKSSRHLPLSLTLPLLLLLFRGFEMKWTDN